MDKRRFTPRKPSRGGFPGRGGLNASAKKRSSQDAALDNTENLEDSASRPEKMAPMDEDKDAHEMQQLGSNWTWGF
jgi:hypothetical protein